MQAAPAHPTHPTTMQRLGSRLRRIDLKVIVPVVITLGMLAFVGLIAAAPKSGAELSAVLQRTWWIALLLAVPYIGARAVVWHELLAQLQIKTPWRLTLVALAGGEIAKTLPGGVYLQNYILARSTDHSEALVVRSATATTATLGLESALALPAALLIGLPGAPWLSRTLLGAVGGWIVLLAALWFLIHAWQVHLAPGTPNWLRRGLGIAEEVFAAARDLMSWRTIRILIPTAVYMLVYVIELRVIAAAVGASMIGFREAMGIYAIIVLAIILVPLPTKLGATEITGLTTFVAYGVAAPAAAVIMLGLRIVSTGATMLVAGLVMLALRRDLAHPRAASAQAAPAAPLVPLALPVQPAAAPTPAALPIAARLRPLVRPVAPPAVLSE